MSAKHMLMQEEEEIFDITVNIHEGLEPLTFTIIVSDDTSTPEHVLDFKVTRNKETLFDRMERITRNR